MLLALVGAASAAAGVLSGLVMARYTLRKDKREAAETNISIAEAETKQAAADDAASDRVLKLLNDANELAIKNERLQYEIKLNEEITKLKQLHKKQFDEMRASLMEEMQRRIREAFDVYGCENAAAGCPTRRPRTYSIPADIKVGGTD